LARAAGRARPGFPGPSSPLEELAAMARGIRSGTSKQLSPYGVLAVCQLELSDHSMPRASPEVVPDTWLRVPGIAVPGTPSDRLVLDGRFCGRIVVAADSLGQHVTLLFAVPVLFVEIPCGVPIEVLPASLFVARDLGSSPGFANLEAEAELGHDTGHNHHRIDASRLEQQSSSLVGTAAVDIRLGVVRASVVSGRNCTESDLKGWMGRQRRPVERAAGTTNRIVVDAKVMTKD